MKKALLLGFAALLAAAATGLEVGGYYPGYGVKGLPPEKIDLDTYDLIYHAFLRFDRDGKLQPDDGLEIARTVKAVHAKPGRKILISVGGGNYNIMPTVCETPEKADQAAAKIVEFALQNGYDGVDLDWEGDMNKVNAERFKNLADAIRKRLDAAGPGKLFTITVGAEWFVRHLDKEMLNRADRINLMAYDFNWSQARYHAPLRAPADPPGAISTERVLKFFADEKDLPKDKICIGLPFYGYAYENLAPGEAIPKNDPAKRRASLGWKDIAKKSAGMTRTFDPQTCGVSWQSADGKTLILADDAESIAAKTRWAKENGYRGVFVWAIYHDRMPDGSTPLTDALRNAAK